MEDMPCVAEQMRGMFVVVLNLESLPQSLTPRVLDTVSGIAYGMDYKKVRISSHCYLILSQYAEFISEEPIEEIFIFE
jgi:FtsZ-interacting cell division protein YlmF